MDVCHHFKGGWSQVVISHTEEIKAKKELNLKNTF